MRFELDTYGQIIICGIKGVSLLPEEAAFIQNEKIGGVILYSHNYGDPAQLAELVNSIQKLRDDYPLFIATGHEDEVDLPFRKQFSQFPSMLEISEINSPKLIFEVSEIIAKELAACGVNLLFSPCCDILTNPNNKYIGNKAYGKDAETVEKNISAVIRGLQTNGVLACAKHFPGMGEVTQNPNVQLPLVKTSIDELKSREVIPFVKASKSRAEFMMMGNVLIDSIDDKLPASLSSKAYSFLRNETKFSKIVVTDDLSMKSISSKFSPEEAALKAIAAGADMLLFKDMGSAQLAISAVRESVKKRLLKKEILLEKLGRIERCKKENFPNYQPIYIPKVADVFNSLEAKKVKETIQSKLVE